MDIDPPIDDHIESNQHIPSTFGFNNLLPRPHATPEEIKTFQAVSSFFALTSYYKVMF